MAIPLLTNPWMAIELLMFIFTLSYFLYKSNPTFTLVEHILIGIASGNVLVLSVTSSYNLLNRYLSLGNYLYLIPLIMAFMIFSPLSKQYTWLARWPTAVLVGVGVGIGVRGAVQLDFAVNVQYLARGILGGKTTPIDNFLEALIAITVVYYFVFTRGTGKILKGSPDRILERIGRYGIMLTMGAQFSSTIVTRIAWFSGVPVAILQILGLR